jgi:hypothetical protein
VFIAKLDASRSDVTANLLCALGRIRSRVPETVILEQIAAVRVS